MYKNYRHNNNGVYGPCSTCDYRDYHKSRSGKCVDNNIVNCCKRKRVRSRAMPIDRVFFIDLMTDESRSVLAFTLFTIQICIKWSTNKQFAVYVWKPVVYVCECKELPFRNTQLTPLRIQARLITHRSKYSEQSQYYIPEPHFYYINLFLKLKSNCPKAIIRIANRKCLFSIQILDIVYKWCCVPQPNGA